ncbi:hypothetical protein LGV61_01335 [Desulfurispirillum indicum]|uniref:hypothetical protein n=1 Tax=Desulfurispirillum indicum TaxID=936456 RepID=UPI001CFB4844|nr:hypothetical protein [Desulfurispirillum indicum]UCZ56945.1 hypothetical protein LGV61_01335 [Desulfurispirillum indicum]
MQSVSSTQPGKLRAIFKQLGYPQPDSVLESWYQKLSCVIAKQKYSLADEDNLRSLVQEMKASSLPASAWLDLYRLCIGSGLFAVALLLRNMAIECAVSTGLCAEADIGELELGFAAAVDSGQWDVAQKILNQLASHRYPSDRVQYAQWVIDIFSGKDNALSPVHLYCQGFKKLIQGNRIAIVGPVPSSAQQGLEIDSFDQVVKFNYRGGEKGRDPIVQGGRISISYYNMQQSKVLAKQGFQDVFDALDAFVFIKKKSLQYFTALTDKSRVIYRYDWMLMDSELNVGPNATLDCLAFNPEQIKIFNIDLMLTAQRAEGYRPNSALPINYLRSFVKTHDPAMQFQFFSHAYHAGLIDGDERFNAVINLGLEGYMRALQKMHGLALSDPDDDLRSVVP